MIWRWVAFIRSTKPVQRFLKAKIKTKINIYYFSVFFVSIALILLLFNGINAALMDKRSAESAGETLQAVNKNFNYILQNVTQFSNYLYFDDNVQQTLRETTSKGVDLKTQEILNKSLINMLISCDYMSSVYLFDNYGNVYTMNKTQTESVDTDKVPSAPWFQDVKAAGGHPVWLLDDGSVVLHKNGSRTLSLARIICDINDYRPLGVLLVNIDTGALQNMFGKIGDGYVFITDPEGRYLTHAPGLDEKDLPPLRELVHKNTYTIKTIGGARCLVIARPADCAGLRLVGVLPINELSRQFGSTGTISILVLLLNLLFLFASKIYISRLITNPLVKMEKYMVCVQNGQFETIPLDAERDDEIVGLKRVFNSMVGQIRQLIQKVTDEQKQLRFSELSLLRAQINPHFLYNTLDAVSALSLINDSKNAFTLTQALERFYRISLSSGNDIITVGEEIACIKNYVSILNIRYRGIFDVEYRIADDIVKKKILKLILQPFVENAIAHGMRNKRTPGKILVSGRRDGNHLIFTVEDDGVGMSKEKICQIMSRKNTTGRGGFGIYSSIVRMTLFYGVEDPVHIWSEPDKGTKVEIFVPSDKEDTHGEI